MQADIYVALDSLKSTFIFTSFITTLLLTASSPIFLSYISIITEFFMFSTYLIMLPSSVMII